MNPGGNESRPGGRIFIIAKFGGKGKGSFDGGGGEMRVWAVGGFFGENGRKTCSGGRGET